MQVDYDRENLLSHPLVKAVKLQVEKNWHSRACCLFQLLPDVSGIPDSICIGYSPSRAQKYILYVSNAKCIKFTCSVYLSGPATVNNSETVINSTGKSCHN